MATKIDIECLPPKPAREESKFGRVQDTPRCVCSSLLRRNLQRRDHQGQPTSLQDGLSFVKLIIAASPSAKSFHCFSVSVCQHRCVLQPGAAAYSMIKGQPFTIRPLPQADTLLAFPQKEEKKTRQSEIFIHHRGGFFPLLLLLFWRNQ